MDTKLHRQPLRNPATSRKRNRGRSGAFSSKSSWKMNIRSSRHNLWPYHHYKRLYVIFTKRLSEFSPLLASDTGLKGGRWGRVSVNHPPTFFTPPRATPSVHLRSEESHPTVNAHPASTGKIPTPGGRGPVRRGAAWFALPLCLRAHPRNPTAPAPRRTPRRAAYARTPV